MNKYYGYSYDKNIDLTIIFILRYYPFIILCLTCCLISTCFASITGSCTRFRSSSLSYAINSTSRLNSTPSSVT